MFGALGISEESPEFESGLRLRTVVVKVRCCSGERDRVAAAFES